MVTWPCILPLLNATNFTTDINQTPRGYIILNSAEHEIYPAHKSYNANYLQCQQ